ncbi:MAG: hypothetical protein ACJ763_00105 [Bdellovibrionia bacterium]
MKDQIDPLYTIFEQHLYNFQDSDSDRKTFIVNIVKDYVNHLSKMNIMIPKSLENSVLEELADQVNTMLVKKIYGCLTIEDFQRKASPPARKQAKRRYSQLKKSADTVKSSPRRSARTARASGA